MTHINQTLRCGDRSFMVGEKTLIMGILNVTPDSFSDGGKYLNKQSAIEHGLRMIEEGADILDIGAMATSPNIKPVSVAEEIDRIMPVISGLHHAGITNICIDTMRSAVAAKALSLGASWINDQSGGLYDEDMIQVMAKADAVIIMHNTANGKSGVDHGEQFYYENVVDEIRTYFKNRIEHLCPVVHPHKIIVDPGIGFGKGLNDSLAIINNMHRFFGLGIGSMIGISRKSFIGKLSGIKQAIDRDVASLGATAMAVFSGVNIIRTHNVSATKEMLLVIDACLKQRKV